MIRTIQIRRHFFQWLKLWLKAEKVRSEKSSLPEKCLNWAKDEKEIHHETGEEIAKSGIDFLIGVRGLAKEMIERREGKRFERNKVF